MSEGAEEMPKGAERVTASLDLLTDEPLELAVALEKLAKIKSAGGFRRGEWQAFVDHLDGLVAALQELNEPSQKRAKDEASEKTEE
jgi:hypothetical protein